MYRKAVEKNTYAEKDFEVGQKKRKYGGQRK